MGLFSAKADLMAKIAFRLAAIGLAVVCTNTCRRTDELADKGARHWISLNSQREIDNSFAKRGSPLF
jgi:hypothetical protein